VPLSSIVEINAEIKSLVAIALESKTEYFKIALKDKGVDDAVIDSILLSVRTCEDLLSQTFDFFKNVKATEKYLTSDPNYVKPVRVSLGAGEFQYIPVVETLKKIAADHSFQKLRKYAKTPSQEDGESMDFCLSDLDDGRRLRNSSYFLKNPNAFRFVLSYYFIG
jgi:hypothetical protein